MLRLKGPAKTLDLELPYELKAWLPGNDQCPADRIVLPGDAPGGKYELQLGIVLAGEKTPFILPANHGRTTGGWLRIGPVEVSD